MHDLVVGLVDDPRTAATATADVVLRSAARSQDGVHDQLDSTTLRSAAVAHVVALAEGGQLGRSPSDVLDLAVLDLVDRRALDGRTTALVAGIRHRSIPQRRARALRIIATSSQAPAEAGRERATAPLRPAPRAVLETVEHALSGAGPRGSTTGSGVRGVVVATVAAVAALGAIVAGTPRLVGEATAPSDVVVGVPVDFTPVPSTGVVVEGGPTGTQVAGDAGAGDVTGVDGEAAAGGRTDAQG